jgi:microcystin-dependent protein
LVAGNKFRVINSSNNNQGDYVVSERLNINSFTALTPAISSVNGGYILKHGLSANGASSDSDAENLGTRSVTFFDKETLVTNSGIDTTTTTVPVSNTYVAIAKRFPLGSYIQIDEEIMRVANSTLTTPSVGTVGITVIRGVLATKQVPHESGSLVRKIKPIPIEFRRPSIVRASGHTFEYLGYGPGNYSTGLPQVQVITLTEREEFLVQSQERSGGVVVYTGMNNNGDSFIGNRKTSSSTGEEITFDNPIPTITGEDPSRLSVIFDEVTVKERLVVEGGNSGNVLSQFDGPVTFNKEVRINSNASITGSLSIKNNLNVTGNITASRFIGNLTGNADTATQISTGTTTGTASYYPTFVDSNNSTRGNEFLYTDVDISYNPSSGYLTANGLISDELRCRTSQQLILNAGESSGKVSGQTNELVYVNAEGGLSVNTPNPSTPNWATGYTVDTTIVKGDSITIKGNTVWHSGNDGSGSGLDADLLDGRNLDFDAATANTVAGRNSSGDIFARLIRSTFANRTSAIDSDSAVIMRVNDTTDNFHRPVSGSVFADWFGVNVPNITATNLDRSVLGGNGLTNTGTGSLNGQNVTLNVGPGDGISVAANSVAVDSTVVRTSGNQIITGTVSATSFIGNGITPIGGIIMWSGSIANIPTGWALCNGASGTPNLQDRFIVGAGSAYTPGNTGGLNSVILQTSEIASHNHSGSIASAGGHTHSGSTNTAGSHNHTYTGHNSSSYRLGSNTAQDTSKSTTRTTGNAGSHSHSLDINSVGNHNHGITIGNTGGNGAHENRPPYYSLAFIMRTS